MNRKIDVDSLNISIRLRNVLILNGFKTLNDAENLTFEQWKNIKNAGKKTWVELQEVIAKSKWHKDANKDYLWTHDSLPISVMVFSNNDVKGITCIWVKTIVDGEYMSNYFVYNAENENIHPLDYAIELVERFGKAKEEETTKDVPKPSESVEKED